MAPTWCGSNPRAAIRCGNARPSMRRSSTAASGASNWILSTTSRATVFSRWSTAPRCSSKAGAPASPSNEDSGTTCCTRATPRWSMCRFRASARSRRWRDRGTRQSSKPSSGACPSRRRTATARRTPASRSPASVRRRSRCSAPSPHCVVPARTATAVTCAHHCSTARWPTTRCFGVRVTHRWRRRRGPTTRSPCRAPRPCA